MSRKYPTQYHQADGWSKWIPPRMRLYKMACCDCNLVHDMKFKVVKVVKRKRDGTKIVEPVTGYEVLFKARRNNRATAAKRRKRS